MQIACANNHANCLSKQFAACPNTKVLLFRCSYFGLVLTSVPRCRIWLDYTKFLWIQRVVNRTRKTYDRALRSLPITQHDKIWKQYTKFVKEAEVPEMACR